ncbi:receptor-type tyrosine-protein phosphatase T-like isoform X2 [Cherax quadricarinatus]
MVHDSQFSLLSLTCLAQDQAANFTKDDIRSWSYGIFPDKERGKGAMRTVAKRKIVLTTSGANQHAFRCLGRSSATDVLAVISFPKSDYHSRSPTLRFSKGEEVTIPVVKINQGLSDEVYIKKVPDNWSSNTSKLPSLQLGPAQLHHTGVYLVHSDVHTNRGNYDGAYFDVMIRECEKDKYGVHCSDQCPKCLHGGQCHSQTGTCVCPPGFIGDTCQYACLPGTFGAQCQLACDRKTLEFNVNKDGDCRSLIICLPKPYGCSCAPGYTYLDGDGDNKICTGECPVGKFGADCSESCEGCKDSECDRFTGTCIQGCQGGAVCTAAPSSPQVSVKRLHRALRITITNGNIGEIYFVTHQFLGYESCNGRRKSSEPVTAIVNAASLDLSNLEPYANYNICVVAANSGGHSQHSCKNPRTLPEAPDVEVGGFTCWPYYSQITCQFSSIVNCENYNGPNISVIIRIKTNLPCNNTIHELSQNVLIPTDHSPEVTFHQVLAGQTYQVTAQVHNTAGVGELFVSTSVTTAVAKPPPVQNLTSAVIDTTTVQLLWNDPCPSNGEITYYYVYNQHLYIKDAKCNTSRVFDRCYGITGLTLGQTYYFKVIVYNSVGGSDSETITVQLMERAPGPPEFIRSVREYRQLDLFIGMPTDPGGTLRNCSLTLSESSQPCHVDVIVDQLTPCKFENLKPGKTYQANASCCNSMFCGETRQQPVATKPIKPEISSDPTILKKTNTTITLGLPYLNTYGDGKSFMAVVVHQAEKPIHNISGRTFMLLQKNLPASVKKHSRHAKRQAEQSQSCQEIVWVAGLLNQSTQEFKIGDAGTYGGFHNCPLTPHEKYNLGIMAVTELLGEWSYELRMLPESVVAEPWEAPALALWWLIIITLLIVFILFSIIYFRHRKNPGKLWPLITFNTGNSNQALHDKNENVYENHGSVQDTAAAAAATTSKIPSKAKIYTPLANTVQVPAPSQDFSNALLPQVQSNSEVAANGAIYSNLNSEDIYENVTRQVSYAKVEAYLNRTIKSYEAAEEFRSVPDNYNKSTDAALLPVNKPKNRFKNNLPYDDTRVVLSLINDDPHSDYINANHVSGHGDVHYIAAQGPKDKNVSTIADFWRMIVEYNISVIIMVANFVEEGKSKVGEYLRPGTTLDFDGYFVSVIKREQLPHFNVTAVQVSKDGHNHTVQHYHYTSWPDHGIPNEAGSLAQMIRHFQRSHYKGGTVVHCSAGIGRTGTVLQVLLMCEMLTLKGSFDPIEVLRHLRACRARLVENQAQYNLSLEIMEEVLFGEETIVSAEHLQNFKDSYLKDSMAQFRKAKALPSPLTYKSSSNPSFQAMNRNISVLPADSQRLYLQMEHGAQETQYINAIKIAGFINKEILLVTEHPMSSTLSKFWRLVVEKGCSVIVFLNHFEEHSKEEFPDVIPYVGDMWTIGDFTIHVEASQPYGNSLTQNNVKIINSKNLTHNVQVYQVLSWPYGQDVPPQPDVLPKIAELLLKNTSGAQIGPPLLCCGDGVTACGLVAAMTLLVERLQIEQCVDVYRTVVKLLRCRPQFITTKAQYDLLYSGAAMYIENYSTYGNFF